MQPGDFSRNTGRTEEQGGTFEEPTSTNTRFISIQYNKRDLSLRLSFYNLEILKVFTMKFTYKYIYHVYLLYIKYVNVCVQF